MSVTPRRRTSSRSWGPAQQLRVAEPSSWRFLYGATTGRAGCRIRAIVRTRLRSRLRARGESGSRDRAPRVRLRSSRHSRAGNSRSEAGGPALAYVTLEALRIKVALSTGSLSNDYVTNDAFAGTTVPTSPYAEYLALQALLKAGLGSHAPALEQAAEARRIGNSATAISLAAWAEAIVSLLGPAPGRTAGYPIEELIETTRQDECLGSVVWAYRVCPEVLSAVRPSTPAARTLGSSFREPRIADLRRD